MSTPSSSSRFCMNFCTLATLMPTCVLSIIFLRGGRRSDSATSAAGHTRIVMSLEACLFKRGGIKGETRKSVASDCTRTNRVVVRGRFLGESCSFSLGKLGKEAIDAGLQAPVIYALILCIQAQRRLA